MKTTLSLALASALALSACATGPAALFDVEAIRPWSGPEDTLDFFAFPYPNALRLDADGTPALSRFHRPDAVLGGYVDVIDQHSHGFGPTQAVYFRFDGAIDPSSLPDMFGSQSSGASAFLVDVTPGSPHRGDKLPLQFKFSATKIDFIGENWLAMQPVPGFPPREGATYAAVLTDRLQGEGGGAVRPSPAFARVRDGAPLGAIEEQLAPIYAPLRDWLDEKQLTEHVVSATVYTTAIGTTIMDELRTAVYATPAPTLTELVHERTANTFELFTGRFDSPNFQEGFAPYTYFGGAIHRGPDGKPTPTLTESLRVAMSIPKGAMPIEGWPVIIYAHGTGGDYHSFVDDGTARRFAAVANIDNKELARFAVLSIDQVLHGPRSPEGTDVETSFFNFNNLVAARDNPKQGALDDFQLLRLIKVVDVAAAPVTKLPIRFDATKVYFFGHSQGSLTGGLYVAAEPEVKAAIFSGAGAGLVAALLTKTKPVDVSAIVQSFFRDQVDDYHPFLNMLQGFFDETDPGNYARRYFQEPPPGMAPKSIYITLGTDDSYSPVPTIKTFALASGVVPVNPMIDPIDALPLSGLAFQDAPQTNNVGSGRATGVLCEYQTPPNDDGHFVVFNVKQAIAQSTRFLGTLAHNGAATLVFAP